MIVRTTERGKSNYALVRQEWASAVSAAAKELRRRIAFVGALDDVRAHGTHRHHPNYPGRPAAAPGRRVAAAGHFRQIGAIAMRFGRPHCAAAARGALV